MIRKRASELLKELEEGKTRNQTGESAQRSVQKTNGSAAKAQQVVRCLFSTCAGLLMCVQCKRHVPTAFGEAGAP